ncbi:hypothetical protein Q9L58_009531 [Maublancomyces gigas]|uniref:Gag protein n=1 Tax=Discina gigas TaxID=1032678 RepID=A0ABR3G7P1_9PEZI
MDGTLNLPQNSPPTEIVSSSQNVSPALNVSHFVSFTPSLNVPPSQNVGIATVNDPVLQIQQRGQSLPSPRDMFTSIANLGNTGAINAWMQGAVSPQDRALQSQAIIARLKSAIDIAIDCAIQVDNSIIKPEKLFDQPGGKTNYETLIGFFKQNSTEQNNTEKGSRKDRCFSGIERLWNGWTVKFEQILPELWSVRWIERLYSLAVDRYTIDEALLAINFTINERLSRKGPGQRRTTDATVRDIQAAQCILEEWRRKVNEDPGPVNYLEAYLARKEADHHARIQQESIGHPENTQISAPNEAEEDQAGEEQEEVGEGGQAGLGLTEPTELGKLKDNWEAVFNLANDGPPGIRMELQRILVPKPGGEDNRLFTHLLKEVRSRYRIWAPKQSKRGPPATALDGATSQTGKHGKRQKFSHEN